MKTRTYNILRVASIILFLVAYSLIKQMVGNDYLDETKRNVIWLICLPIIFMPLALYALTMNRIYRILTHHCDPERFLSRVYRLEKEKIDRGNKLAAISADKRTPRVQKKVHMNTKSRASISLFIIEGLLSAGKYDEYEKLINALVSAFSDNAQERYRLTVTLTHKMSILRKYGDIAAAKEVFEQIKALMPKLKPRQAKVLAGRFSLYACLIRMEEGDYSDAVLTLNEALKAAKTPLARITVQMYLGRAYMHLGQTEEARAAFEYVIANGNKLYAVTEAQNYLKALAAF